MEGVEELMFGSRVAETLKHSRLLDQNLDAVGLHCRRDHLSPSFHQHSPSSCYQASYSPQKHTNYNQPELQQGLQRFRKYQNSTTMLPSLTKVSKNSQYQKSYLGKSQEKQPRAHEKSSHFIKHNWAIEPSSNYQKDFKSRQNSQWNKDNKNRATYDLLAVFKLKEKPERNSNYRSDFKVFNIKKQAQMSLGGKDHLASVNKQNINEELTISEYQRRYDSVMERTKARQTQGLGIYKKDCTIKRRKD